jgi:hypothetical protein
MPIALPLRLIKCPNCLCGIELDSAMCGYCGALFETSGRGEKLSARQVVCFDCRAQNLIARTHCATCHKPLLQSCPRCAAALLDRESGSCPQCDLPRSDFFSYCIKKKNPPRSASSRAMFILVGAFLFVILGWYNHSNGYLWQALGSAIMAALFLLFFILAEFSFGDWRLRK